MLRGDLGLEQCHWRKKGEEKITRIMRNIEDLTLNLKETMVKTNAKIDSILSNFNNFSADLRLITSENKDGIKNIVTNFSEFSSDLRELMRNNEDKLGRLIANLEEFSVALAEDTPEITENLRGILQENRENLKVSLADLRFLGKPG